MLTIFKVIILGIVDLYQQMQISIMPCSATTFAKLTLEPCHVELPAMACASLSS